MYKWGACGCEPASVSHLCGLHRRHSLRREPLSRQCASASYPSRRHQHPLQPSNKFDRRGKPQANRSRVRKKMICFAGAAGARDAGTLAARHRQAYGGIPCARRGHRPDALAIPDQFERQFDSDHLYAQGPAIRDRRVRLGRRPCAPRHRRRRADRGLAMNVRNNDGVARHGLIDLGSLRW